MASYNARSLKPLTKALHTVRVVGRVAYLVLEHHAPEDLHPMHDDPRALYKAVLAVLGNEPTSDATLEAACLEACRDAINGSK